MTDSRSGFWGRLSQALPSLEQIDSNIYRGVAFGFPLLTMVIITGAVWAQYVWQRWWSWDPKETASLVTFLIYAGYLHGRRQRGWQGKTSAWIVLWGFVAVLFTFAGVNFLQSLHSYGMAAAAAPGGRLLGGFGDVSSAEAILTVGFFLCYLVGLIVLLAGAVRGRQAGPGKGTLIVPALGFLGNTVVLAMRMAVAGRVTFTSGYDFSLWFVWGITLCGLVASLGKQRLALLGTLPIALLISMYGYLYFPEKSHSALPPALQNKLWLHIHVALAVLAYGGLALSAAWSMIYLVKAAIDKRSKGAAGSSPAKSPAGR